MSTAEGWMGLARSMDGDPSVASMVARALDHGEDPWAALLDGLDEVGALAYLRAGDTGMELADALAQLPRVFAVQPDLDEASDADDIASATRAAGRALMPHGLRIIRLEEDDDSWPLVVVPVLAADDIEAHIHALGARAHIENPLL